MSVRRAIESKTETSLRVRNSRFVAQTMHLIGSAESDSKAKPVDRFLLRNLAGLCCVAGGDAATFGARFRCR
jgi:hypothetical protein